MTLDNEPRHKPDHLWDIEVLPLPFAHDSFDEIHAYEVLEHCGRLGDYKFFFAQFTEFWRILKPGGYFAATCPGHKSIWALGDPGHRRVFTSGTLVFLDQNEYVIQVDREETRTPMSDYRTVWRGDFQRVWIREDADHLAFVLKAIKPSRLELTDAA